MVFLPRYGQDRRDGQGLAELLRELGKLEGLRWIRILYAYPSYFTEDLIDEIATNPKVGFWPVDSWLSPMSCQVRPLEEGAKTNPILKTSCGVGIWMCSHHVGDPGVRARDEHLRSVSGHWRSLDLQHNLGMTLIHYQVWLSAINMDQFSLFQRRQGSMAPFFAI